MCHDSNISQHEVAASKQQVHAKLPCVLQEGSDEGLVPIAEVAAIVEELEMLLAEKDTELLSLNQELLQLNERMTVSTGRWSKFC